MMKIKRTVVGLLVMALLVATGFMPATEANASSKVGKTTVKVKNTEVGADLKVTWSAVNGASGYDVYMSVAKVAGYKKVATTTDTSYVTSKVKKNRTYYFKVKAFTTVDGQNVYGSYSKAVSGKTCKYLLNTVIDDGGQEVYFYFLTDGKTNAMPPSFWAAWDNCEKVMRERYKNNTHGKWVGTSKKSDAIKYSLNGKKLSIATPHFKFDGTDH